MRNDGEWEEQAGDGGADLTAFVEHFFSPQGPLAAAKNFEYRPQQQKMAVAVSQALENGEHLIVEAGTGVGKSLAYLVPSIFFALLREKKAIISTQTINLQQQLTQKDLPDLHNLLRKEILQKILKEPFRNWLEVLKEKKPFQFAMLTGRVNYLCTRRLERAVRRSEGLFTNSERQELQRIYEWSQITQNGSLDDLKDYLGREPNHRKPDEKVWAQVCSELGSCSPKQCGKDSDFVKDGNPMCFFRRARNKYHSADLVVLNHSLFFSLLRDNEDDSKGLIFPNDFVVFDEAHGLEKIASQHVGIDLRRLQVRYALNRLWNPKTKKGQMTVLPRSAGSEKIIKQVEQLLKDTENFFDELEKAGEKLASPRKPTPQRKEEKPRKPWKTIRVRHPNLLNDSLFNCFFSLSQGPLKDLREQLVGFIQQTKDKETNQELGASNDRLADIQSNLSRWIGQEKEDYVYWIERAGKSQKNISLCASPIHIADWCRKELLDRDTSLILTSATLSLAESSNSTNQGFNHFISKIGGEDIATKQVGSPFDYPNQMRVYLISEMPDPKAREKDFEKALTPWILQSLKQTHGKALVLFTNYHLMNTVYDAVRQSAEKEEDNHRILIQGDGVSNPKLLEQFKQDTDSILFGTDSFWQGVDVPGEALSNVIITRLPFPVPVHPLEEARVESIEARGGNPFLEHSLPEAILKFRQGVGRLIRTKSDQGIIVVLDSRISQKSYGQKFLAAIPQCPVDIV